MIYSYPSLAALATKNNELAKKRLNVFENEAGQEKSLDDSQQIIIHADSLAHENEVTNFEINNFIKTLLN